MARVGDPVLAQRAAVHIVRVLASAGHTAYLAGGCVRDALLGATPADVDIATDATPPRVKALFPRTQEVGQAFGVMIVHIPAKDVNGDRRHPDPVVEVATFRADGPYADARRPDHVTFSDPESDARRRDFTINALFLDPLAPPDEALRGVGPDRLSGRIIDYVGGVADLKAGLIRAVGNPEERLREDHLRALRAVRFAARLGFSIDPRTAEAITRHASNLRGVSRERIGDEVRRMLLHPSAPCSIEYLRRLGLDSPVLGDVHLEAPLALSPKCGDIPDAQKRAMTFLAAWLTARHRHQTGTITWLSDENQVARISSTRAALCLSNDETAALRDVLAIVAALDGWQSFRVARHKRLASKSMFDSALAFFAATSPTLAAEIQSDVSRHKSDGIGVHPERFVTGEDLIGIGGKPGPAFKRVLEEVYDAQLEGQVRSKDEAMELAAKLGV